MIKYTLYQKNPASHYIYIDMHISDLKADKLQLQLPAWRPGRYELGNFAKNIKRVDVFNEKGEAIAYTKLNKDLWEINTNGVPAVKVTYSYYAAELNAGSCFADTSQIYVNPVHCCMYVVGRTNEEHVVELNIPESYRIVSSLDITNNSLHARDYEELVDSPFVASADIKTDHYEEGGHRFYLHFVGQCRPDFSKLKKDFAAFTKKQIQFWGSFPVKEYHFLFQILPTKFYHGVEHQKSTVIAIGPGYAINSGATYEDILGVSSHELFHTWNVKLIRPAEMLPYNYTAENYARTGYVYEGFTTYYGDKHLLGSGVFSTQDYFKTLEERLLKHFHNFGRYNLGVAHSSWETWLDGYVPGAPYRKTNIYDEGNLVAFMLDVKIMEATKNKASLRDVCLLLYDNFGKKGKGYSEQDILQLVNQVSGKDLTAFFNEFVYSPADFQQELSACFNYLGIEFKNEPSDQIAEMRYGMKVAEMPPASRVTLVAPYSPAWKAGLFAGDEILAANGMAVKNNLNAWLNYFQDEEIDLIVNSGDKIKNLKLSKDKKGTVYFNIPRLKMLEKPHASQTAAFKAWKSF